MDDRWLGRVGRVCDRHDVRPHPPAGSSHGIADRQPGASGRRVRRTSDDRFDRWPSGEVAPEEVSVAFARWRPGESQP
jgi:hypothetical protein